MQIIECLFSALNLSKKNLLAAAKVVLKHFSLHFLDLLLQVNRYTFCFHEVAGGFSWRLLFALITIILLLFVNDMKSLF